MVADAWQGRGIGRRLVERLVQRAVGRGAVNLSMDIMGKTAGCSERSGGTGPDATMRVSGGTVEAGAPIPAAVNPFAE